MKKETLLNNVVLSLVFPIFFNIVLFLLIEQFTNVFWISWGLIHFSYLILLHTFFNVHKAKNSVAYAYPLTIISLLYFFILFLVGIIFIIFQSINIKTTVIVFLSLTVVYFFIYFTYKSINQKSIYQDNEVQKDYNFIFLLSSKIKLLMQSEKNYEMFKKLENLYDLLKSSEVKSFSNTKHIENEVKLKIEELENFKDSAHQNKIINDLTYLLKKRNNENKLNY